MEPRRRRSAAGLRRLKADEARPLKNTPALSFPRIPDRGPGQARESMKPSKGLDSCFRRNDDLPGFGRSSRVSRRNRFFWWVVAGLWIGIIFATGCGKKGDPIPPRVRMPAPIADLSAASSAEGMILRWSMPFPQDGIGSFRILRSDAEAAKACPGCPQDHRTLVQLSIADGRLQRDGEKVRYFDADVRPGRFYSYRVASCGSRGDCGEASNTAQKVYEKR